MNIVFVQKCPKMKFPPGKMLQIKVIDKRMYSVLKFQRKFWATFEKINNEKRRFSTF